MAPDDGELQAHFTERFLTAIPAAQLISTLSGQAASLQEELEVTAANAQHVQAELPGLQIQASTETDPPHRLTMLRAFPDGRRITDPRLAAAASRTEGDVPPAVRQIADTTLTELALPGLVLAASTPDAPAPDTPETPGAPEHPRRHGRPRMDPWPGAGPTWTRNGRCGPITGSRPARSPS